ncbi:hypothetical protein DL770_000719 [Monosporascus sp. CRB-9-2]|nr:hypothetical protein DL770_000719 [Monosporascus sp. CRB-9-2]
MSQRDQFAFTSSSILGYDNTPTKGSIAAINLSSVEILGDYAQPTMASDGTEQTNNSVGEEEHPPRPINSWTLFRQARYAATKAANPKLKTNGDVSKALGTEWAKLPDPEKDYWTNLAEEAKRLHKLRYPKYKYRSQRGKIAKGGKSASKGTSKSVQGVPAAQSTLIATSPLPQPKELGF